MKKFFNRLRKDKPMDNKRYLRCVSILKDDGKNVIIEIKNSIHKIKIYRWLRSHNLKFTIIRPYREPYMEVDKTVPKKPKTKIISYRVTELVEVLNTDVVTLTLIGL